MKTLSIVSVLIIMLMVVGTAVADVEEDWALGTSNTHVDQHVLIDFNEGVKSHDPIVCPFPGITFVTMGGDPWVYACNDGLNLKNETSGTGSYLINGWAGAWCGIDGDGGKVVFDNPVSHVSCLASTGSGLIMEAFDVNDNEVTNSSWASGNLDTNNFTRLSVDRVERDISYVIIHDDGNRWLIDDLVVVQGTTFVIGEAFDNDTIPLIVERAENAGSIDLVLSYNASIVEVTNVSGVDMEVVANLEHVDEGWIRIGGYNLAGLTGTFTLADITFTPIGGCESPLEITVTTFKGATLTGNVMDYEVRNGTYCAYLNGDTNGDGIVDMSDAMYLVKHLVGYSGFEYLCAPTSDVDGTLPIDMADASYLAKHVIGIEGYEELK